MGGAKKCFLKLPYGLFCGVGLEHTAYEPSTLQKDGDCSGVLSGFGSAVEPSLADCLRCESNLGTMQATQGAHCRLGSLQRNVVIFNIMSRLTVDCEAYERAGQALCRALATVARKLGVP